MFAFIIWIFLISAALALYSLFLWRRAKGRSRFQARLTILFFLFVLVPTVPLTLSLSMLLTKSTELFMLPDIEESLSETLQLMREQLAHTCGIFLNSKPTISDISTDDLEAFEICYAGDILLTSSGPTLTTFIKSDSLFTKNTFPENLAQLGEGDFLDALTSANNKEYYEYYLRTKNNRIQFIGKELSGKFIDTREKVTLTLRNYSSLSLLRDTFISQGLIWAIAVLFVIILAILAVYIGKNLSRGISEPIQQLSDGMRKVGYGDLSYRVETKAKDEIQFLVGSFNNMTKELEQSRNNLQKAERAAAWRDVARQISHEIKNPLTPIQLSLHRIKSKLDKNKISEPDINNSLTIVEEEIESMRRMANEFAEFARLPHLEFKLEDITEIVQNSITLFEAEVHKITIKFETDVNVPKVTLDKEQFRRVMHNVLKNAMEASSKGDELFVQVSRAELKDFKAKIIVTDKGCGMADETMDNIFKPYFTTKKKGSGLGLFIVKRIINDHGGTIDISSKINTGTTVTIQI
jgi:nitrogen fixation/metabolism regulation signal transduction histidine kinase